MQQGRVPIYLKRRILSLYAGVHADQVADAEDVAVAVVRAARIQGGRGCEYGGSLSHDGRDNRPLGAREGQLSFFELEHLMRSNRAAGL